MYFIELYCILCHYKISVCLSLKTSDHVKLPYSWQNEHKVSVCIDWYSLWNMPQSNRKQRKPRKSNEFSQASQINISHESYVIKSLYFEDFESVIISKNQLSGFMLISWIQVTWNNKIYRNGRYCLFIIVCYFSY